MSERQRQLFTASEALPEGLLYEPDFLSREEEADLPVLLRGLPFEEAQYRQWMANRRVVSFGGRYDFTHQELLPAPEIPAFLGPLRARISSWAGIPFAEVAHAMIAEYRPGTQLGWHRDVPNFEVIAGVSLAGSARMRLRPYPPAKGQRARLALDIEPRSAYLMRGPARWNWQHAISPTRELRYSITFRTRSKAV